MCIWPTLRHFKCKAFNDWRTPTCLHDVCVWQRCSGSNTMSMREATTRTFSLGSTPLSRWSSSRPPWRFCRRLALPPWMCTWMIGRENTCRTSTTTGWSCWRPRDVLISFSNRPSSEHVDTPFKINCIRLDRQVTVSLPCLWPTAPVADLAKTENDRKYVIYWKRNKSQKGKAIAAR